MNAIADPPAEVGSLTTGDARELIAQYSRETGIDHHLSKPFEMDALHALLSAVHSSLS